MTAQRRYRPGWSVRAVELINRVQRCQPTPLPTFSGDLPIPRPHDRATSAGGTVAAGSCLPDPHPAATSTTFVIPLDGLLW
jgi:hypothetical protein